MVAALRRLRRLTAPMPFALEMAWTDVNGRRASSVVAPFHAYGRMAYSAEGLTVLTRETTAAASSAESASSSRMPTQLLVMRPCARAPFSSCIRWTEESWATVVNGAVERRLTRLRTRSLGRYASSVAGAAVFAKVRMPWHSGATSTFVVVREASWFAGTSDVGCSDGVEGSAGEVGPQPTSRLRQSKAEPRRRMDDSSGKQRVRNDERGDAHTPVAWLADNPCFVTESCRRVAFWTRSSDSGMQEGRPAVHSWAPGRGLSPVKEVHASLSVLHGDADSRVARLRQPAPGGTL